MRPGSPADLQRRGSRIVQQIENLKRVIETQRRIIAAKNATIDQLQEHIDWLERGPS